MKGPLLVALAATLWATDALFRMPALDALDPTFIVFMEHLIGVAFLLPWVLSRHQKALFRLSPTEWGAAAIVGVGGSALATMLFTASFRYVNPSVAILLQKLQPVLVILLAYLFLGERPARGFYAWGALALAAAIALGFPDLNLELGDARLTGMMATLAAAAIWAVSTIAGKVLLRRTHPSVATFWRIAFGLAGVTAILLASSPAGGLSEHPGWAALRDPKMLGAVTYMGLVAGLLAMVAYYAGMRRTSASVVTVVELIFPVGAVILNWIFLGQALTAAQLAAGSVLVFAVSRVTLRG